MRGEAPDSLRRPSTLGMGCLAPVLLLALLVAGQLAVNASGGSPWLAPLLAGGLLLAGAAASARFTARERALTALAILPAAVLVSVVARHEVTLVLIGGSAGEALFALYMAIPALAAAAIGAALGTLLARAFVRRAGMRAAHLLQALAIASILAVFALLAVAVARPRAPSLAQYLASLPIAGRAPALAEGTQELAAGRLHLRRDHGGRTCAVSFALDKPAEKPLPWYDEYGFGPAPFEPCGAIEVLADDPRGLWIAAADDGARIVYGMQPSLHMSTLTADMLTAGKRPPTGYLALAAAALAAALVALVWRAKPRLPAADPARCREGRLEADGQIHFPGADLPPAAPPAGAVLAEGPVVVELAPDRGPFRGAVEVVRAVPGTIGALRSEPALAAGATALALVCLGAAPLWAALR